MKMWLMGVFPMRESIACKILKAAHSKRSAPRKRYEQIGEDRVLTETRQKAPCLYESKTTSWIEYFLNVRWSADRGGGAARRGSTASFTHFPHRRRELPANELLHRG